MIEHKNPSSVLDMLMVGAGPAGLAAAITAERYHVRYLVVEKGCLVNSVYHFPVNMVFIGGAKSQPQKHLSSFLKLSFQEVIILD
jgi:thioredoxin reductase